MKAEEKSISQLLTEQLRYEIPRYQRPYSWQAEHVQDLLEDVQEACDKNDKEYFIGSLITIKPAGGELHEIVDGQQRLTTLNLIFARLKEKVDDTGVKADIDQRLRPRNPYTGDTELPRLALRSRDQAFFRDYVLEATPFDKLKVSQLDAPKANMLRNMLCIDDFFLNRTQSWLKTFGNYILERVFVVLVKTESIQSAFRLFNVLNARGLGLSNADLIKNELFGGVGSNAAHSDQLELLWVELEDTAGIDNLDTFLGTHRTTIVAEKARQSLAEEFENIIASDTASPIEFVKGLIASVKNYDRIVDAEFSDQESLRSLAALKRVTYDEWMPALLAFLNSPVADMPEAEFLVLLEKITMQNWIRRLGRTKRNTIYYRLIMAINKGETSDQIRAVFRDSSNNTEVFSLLQGDIYGLASARSILLRLEEGMQDLSVSKQFGGELTIEHVLPQALKDDYWTGRFSEDEHLKWLHTLGNITLLSGRKNSKAQYYAFPKKKAVYLKANEKVSFDMTKEICEVSDWTVAEIKARQERMVGIARKLWTID